MEALQAGAQSSKPAAPVEKEDHASGKNPLQEGKDATVRRRRSRGSQVQYTDREDMPTRYRPGNNKTTAVKGGHAAGRHVTGRRDTAAAVRFDGQDCRVPEGQR
jgi:hypothetical protein